ncbi:hypothetical protein B6D29_00380 [Microgenomates bacterium UTCPR1]|nr:MAG: hypothetical protein B6D29_00380 [Microgenomates bacterium UTCPR1]
MANAWHTDIVVHGKGGGKKLGFPTINLNPTPFIDKLKEGVYSCKVKYKDKKYLGALYFGPRTINRLERYILEVNIFDFSQSIYGEKVEFKIGQFIRDPITVKNEEELINQMNEDVRKIQSL